MDDYLIYFVLTVIGGGIGGFIGHQLAWSLFRKQAIFQTGLQYTIKRRDALCDAIALAHDINRGFTFGWKCLGEEDPDTAKRLDDWIAQLNSAASLFLGDDQAEKGLFGLRNLIGIDPGNWQKSNVDPFAAYSKDKKTLEQVLERIDSQLTG